MGMVRLHLDTVSDKYTKFYLWLNLVLVAGVIIFSASVVVEIRGSRSTAGTREMVASGRGIGQSVTRA